MKQLTGYKLYQLRRQHKRWRVVKAETEQVYATFLDDMIAECASLEDALALKARIREECGLTPSSTECLNPILEQGLNININYWRSMSHE